MDRVDEQILSLVGIADHIVLVQTGLKRLRRQGSVVLNDALDPPVVVARTEDDARIPEFVLKANHIFIEVLTASSLAKCHRRLRGGTGKECPEVIGHVEVGHVERTIGVN